MVSKAWINSSLLCPLLVLLRCTQWEVEGARQGQAVLILESCKHALAFILLYSTCLKRFQNEFSGLATQY